MLDVQKSRELQAALLAMKSVDRSVRNDINKTARTRLKPIWTEALSFNARDRMSQAVIVKGSRVAVTARQVRLMAATSRRPLRGGLVPDQQWTNVEFGANDRKKTFKQRSRRGRTYERTATINRQFPQRSKNGRIAFDAASHTGTQLVALWVHSIVDELKKVPGAEVTG